MRYHEWILKMHKEEKMTSVIYCHRCRKPMLPEVGKMGHDGEKYCLACWQLDSANGHSFNVISVCHYCGEPTDGRVYCDNDCMGADNARH